MHSQLQKYIKRINDNDTTLTHISLSKLGLNNDDITPLMTALANNPEAAQRIKSLGLDDNKLTSFHILDTLTNLRTLYLNNNQITTIHIPDTITKLNVLGLCENQLTAIHIPDTLIELEVIALNKNQLKTFKVPYAPNLSRLSLDYNQLITLNLKRFLPGCLFIRHNQLTTATKIALEAISLEDFVAYGKPSCKDVQLTTEILDEHFRAIISRTHPLHCEFDDSVSITELLNKLRSAIIPDTSINNTIDTTITSIKCMFPDNDVVQDYLSSRAIGKTIHDAHLVFDRNFEVLKCAVKDDNLCILEEVIGELESDPEFSFHLGQKLLHDIYLETPQHSQANLPVIKRLAQWVLSTSMGNPNFEFNDFLKIAIDGHANFKSEVTALKKIIGSISNNPFLFNNYLNFAIKDNMVIKPGLPITWSYLSMNQSLSDNTRPDAKYHHMQITAWHPKV